MKKNILLLVSLIAGTSFGQLDRSVVPEAQPNPEIKINIPDVQTKENGLKVIVVENHKLPTVSFQLYVDYPTIAEGNKAGMQNIFGQMLSGGSISIPKDDFDERIDYMGATLFTTSRGFFASSLKKHTPKLLSLLSEIVTNAALPEEEFERIKKQEISNMAGNQSDASYISSVVNSAVNYGLSHPYGEVATEQTLANITLEDIKNHYSKYFIPNYSYLVIVGDITQEEADGYVNKYFGHWKQGGIEKGNAFETPKSEGNQVYFTKRPGAVQSVINISHTVDLRPGHPDAIKLRLLNHILGGGSFSARLMSNLREDKAYTYGCYSSLNADEMVGLYTASGSFRNDVTDSAIVQILFEIEKISKEMVTEKEIELAKNSITGSFARSLEQPRTVAQFALNTAKYNLPKDYYQTYLQKLEQITREDLLEVAQKYLRPTNLNIIVVGNEDIAEKLTVFDSDGQISYKDFNGQDEVQLTAVAEGITAESIVSKYIANCLIAETPEAQAKRLKKVGYLRVTYKAYIEEMDATLYMTSYSGKPNKTAQTMKAAQGAQKMVVSKEWFNGETGGTFVMGQGKTTYEGEELENKKKPNFPFSQLYYFEEGRYDIKLLGIASINDQEYYKIKVNKKGEDDFSYEFYNVMTGFIDREETYSTDEEGNASNVVITYSDYKDIGGVKVPSKMEINSDGQLLTFELESAEVAKKAHSAVFDGEFK